jgi:hypothetical protein
MYNSVLCILICVFIVLKTISYSIWSYKNTGAAGGTAVLVIAVLTLLPLTLFLR